MGTAERRERERHEVRQKILDAARELMLREGYEQMTMRRIAEAIEYSPTAIYHHFKDKDEVVHTLCQEDFQRLLGALQNGVSAEDPLQTLRVLGLAYASFALRYPNHYRFMFMTQAKPDHVLTPEDAGWQAFALLAGAVEAAAAQGLLRPGKPAEIAQVLWSMMHGVSALLVTYRPEQFPVLPPANDLVEQVMDAALRGVLAHPKPQAPEPRD